MCEAKTRLARSERSDDACGRRETRGETRQDGRKGRIEREREGERGVRDAKSGLTLRPELETRGVNGLEKERDETS